MAEQTLKNMTTISFFDGTTVDAEFNEGVNPIETLNGMDFASFTGKTDPPDVPFISEHKAFDKDHKSMETILPNIGDTPRNFMIQHEGNKTTVHDVEGIPHIGIGRKLTEEELESGIILIGGKEVEFKTKGITNIQMNTLFEEDFSPRWEVAGELIKKAKLDHVPNLQTALASFLYNTSSKENPEAGFKKIAPLAYNALMRGDLEAFKAELFDPERGVVKGGGKILRGLVNRRQAELALLDPNRGIERAVMGPVGAFGGPVDAADFRREPSNVVDEGDVTIQGSKDIGATHTVVSGDTLGKIARDNNTTVDAIMEVNRGTATEIKDANNISIGDQINLGGSDTVAAPSVTALATPPRKPKGLEDVTPPSVSAKQPVPVAVLPKGKQVEMADAMIEETLLGNPSEVEEQLSFFVGDHASVAIQHMMIGMKEKLGLTVTDEDKAPITEKSVSPQVLDVIKIATYRAWKEKRTTDYKKDYGDAAKLVYGNLRGTTSDVLKNAASSFFDPVAAAGLTIGESSGLKVDKRGHLVLENDEYNFPEIGGKKSDAWLILQRLFSDKSSFFGVRDKKNRIKINFDFGPVKDVEAFVRDLEGKPQEEVKIALAEARSPLVL